MVDVQGLLRLDTDLKIYVEDVFSTLRRKGWQERSHAYLAGLMLDGRRKSVEPMAARLGEANDQSLGHFLANTPWDPVPVRERLARKMHKAIDPAGWVADDSGFTKVGRMSPCVARQYSGTLGKTGNCQIGVSVQMATDTASLAANWRLFCPKSWDDTTVSDPDKAATIRAKRDRAQIGDDVRHREKWRLALDMLDEMIDTWGLPALPVAADSGYGDCTLFRLGLAERGLQYAVQVDPDATAHPADAIPVTAAYTGRGRPPRPAYPDAPVTFKHLVQAAGRGSARSVTWRHGSRRTKNNPTAAMRSHFLRLRIRPANRDITRGDDGSLPECWLIAEWPPEADEPVKYWLSNMSTRTSLRTLIRYAKLRWRVEHDYRELKTGLGIDHFEGRSFTGWHRHVTLTVIAQAFCTLLRLDPKADAPA